ncbi:tRNA preQ1(34) S-adenosylmethionine ribosyltransferase-isomerase QueA [Tissierella creatinophila]|uniref:S-adenosylmethionine:tRNA ribosyltransferase-isomerase n=1 Tax=Tissierella creatinophila DSM 6911 TaxID=1123403 RepID=A0A1U7M2X8_TISCR|nr:tRNA preQ1(34) S-adenosylmethionine ribosyltransferase-isomerase QueA [Tissierella creatinophila]OLS01667.1 S-adenosylmethionine:tRNA ribosyltransferase-isomerase [Tissierella creatinophila DSM 6911]
METKDFFYNLPEELIAQVPLKDRTTSRLLVLDKESGEVEHKKFKDVIDYLNEGDTLILNNTRVLPARLFGNRQNKEERIEFLLLKRNEEDIWQSLVKPGKKAKIGSIVEFGNGLLKGEVIGIDEEGIRQVKFHYDGIFEEVLDSLGEMPLPPYIKEKLSDKERYQTVYSKHLGSAAAPTAGLHFTNELLEKISKKGINIGFITLHVGLGTFRPVKVDDILKHHMHSEFFTLSKETAELINKTKQNGKKIIAVGTTSVRTLETLGNENGLIEAGSGWTDIFIYPGYKFKLVDSLITNFHLPESTLLMLISAFTSRDMILKTYDIAIDEKYRFFSFGDAMIIK